MKITLIFITIVLCSGLISAIDVNELLEKNFIFTDEENVTGEAYNVVEMLKGMNFGLQEELEDCENNLVTYELTTLMAIILAIFMISWRTYDRIKLRRENAHTSKKG